MNWFDSREDLEASALLGELSDLCECPPDTLRRAAKIAETFGFAFFDRLLCLAHRGCEPCGPNGGNGGEKFPPPPFLLLFRRSAARGISRLQKRGVAHDR